MWRYYKEDLMARYKITGEHETGLTESAVKSMLLSTGMFEEGSVEVTLID